MDEPPRDPHELLEYYRRLMESPAAELCRRGQTLAKAGMQNSALQLFEQAVVADPRYGRGWSDLGVCLMLMQRMSEAETALGKAVELVPDNFVPWGCLADVYLRMDRLDDAERCLAACRRLAPEDPRTEQLVQKLRASFDGRSTN